MARNISIRLNLDGAVQLKQQLEDAGVTGGAALDKLRSGLERLGAQDSGAVVQALQRVTQAAQQAQAAVGQAQSNAFAGVQAPTSAVDYKARSADIAAYGAAMDALRAKYNPLYAASKAYETTLDEIAAAEKVGAISATEASAARDRVTTSFAQSQAPLKATSVALKDVTTSSGAAAASMRGLGIQVVQGLSGIATGQPILTTLIQQGHQVVDQSLAMGTGFSGLATAAKGLVSAVGGLPVLLGGTLVAALALLTKVSDDSLGQFAALKVALRGTHDDYAALAQGVEDAAKRVSASSGLGFAEALSAAKTIAQGRYFSGTAADIERLTHDADDLAAVMGTSATDAAKKLADGIEDPSKAAQSLSAALSTTLTPELLRQIDLAQKAGNQNQAFSLLLGAVEGSSKGAARDGLSPLSKAWQDLGNAFTDSTKGWAPFMSYLSTTAASVLEGIATSVRGISNAFRALKGDMNAAGPVIDATTGKAPTGVTLPDGLSNKVYATAEANNISPQIADLATRIIALGEKSPGQYAADGSVLTSPKGAQGLMQIMPGTAADKSINPTGSLDATKLDDNILLGLRYLSQLGQKYNGNEQQIAAAFNAGPGRTDDVLAGKSTLPGETQKYVKNVTGSNFAAAGGSGSTAGSIVSDSKALADNFKTLTDNTQAITAQNLQAKLDEIHKSMDQVAASSGKTSTEYIALQQAEAGVIAQQHANVDAMTAAQRASASALAANQGLTEGERGLAAAIEARHQIALNAGLPFGSAEEQQATLEYLAKQSQAATQAAAAMKLTVGQNQELATAYGQGDQAVADATAKQQAYNEAIKLFPGSAAQQGQAIAALIPLYRNLATSAAEVQVAQKTLANDNQLKTIDAETRSLGMNDNARVAYLAHLQAEQFLLSKNIDLTSTQGAAYLASVDKISAATAAYKGQEASLNELTGFFDSTFSTISDAIVSAFATGEQSAVKFKDIVGSVVKAIEAEFIKLALVNPLKNMLLGSDSPTLSSVTGIIGKLLGNDAGGVAGSAGVTGTAALAGLFDGGGTTLSASSATAGGGGFNDPVSIVGTLGTGAQLASNLTGGSGAGGLISGLADKITDAVTNALGNSTEAINIAADAGNLSNSGIASASIANALGLSDETASAISAATGTIADALPYIGAAISVVTSLVNGDYKSAAFTLAGAAIGTAILPGIGTAVGAAVGSLVTSLFPAHPLHPYSNVDLNIAGGQLTTAGGYDVGQLTDLNADKAGVQAYADSINAYLKQVGVVITDADGTLGHIGAGITGFNRAGLTTGQTADVTTLFKNLSFGGDPNDHSNFGIAKGALTGMSFNAPIDLQNELYKIAGFADAVDALGINLKSVGKDISAIQIASVTGANPDGTSTVTDASGRAITYHSDLRTALNADLPTQTFADTAALDAEMQKVSDFVTGTLPSLLTPAKHVDSTLQDQIQVMNQKYADAAAQSRSYGLNNDQALLEADQRAVQIMMKPAVDGVLATMAGINVRLATATSGTSGAGAATLGNLAATQNNERTTLEDQWRQVWGDGIVSNQAYIASMQQLVDAQNAEVQATQQQIAITQAQGLAGLLATEASNAQAAGINGLGASLAAFDAKAADQRLEFIKAWTDYYGQAAAGSQELQDQLLIMDKASAAQRLQVQQSYSDASVAALKTAQGSVTSLFGSLKDYALKLQTGSQSALSPTSQYDLAKSQFNAVAGAASAGDAASASQLTTYADALLSTSQAVNGSGAAYASDYSKVLDALQGVSAAGDVLTQSFIAQNTQTQTAQLVTAMAGVQNEVAALRREVQQQTRAQAA